MPPRLFFGESMDKRYTVVLNDLQMNSMFRHARCRDIIAVDTETTGLDVHSDLVIGISISGKEGRGYYLPIFMWNKVKQEDGTYQEGLQQFVDYEVVRILLSILQKKKVVCHNASFDDRIIFQNFGMSIREALYSDTQLIKHTIDEVPPFKLKDIAKLIQKEIGLDMSKEANEEQEELIAHLKDKGASLTKEKYEMYKADCEILGKYACADTDLTLRIHNYYHKQLVKEGLVDFYYKDEVMPLYKEVTMVMEGNGVPIDVPALQKAEKDIEIDIKEIELKIRKEIEPYLGRFYEWYFDKKFPVKTTGSFAQAAAKYFKVDVPKTKTGKFSLSAKNIENLEDCDFKDWIQGKTRLSRHKVIDIQKTMTKEQPFLLSSKQHLKKLFFLCLGEKATSKTAKGNPQVDNKFLKSMEEKYTFVKYLLVYNKLNKIKGTYIDRFLKKQKNGFFYPSYFQFGTVSGRYGSDIQQLPRPVDSNKANPLVAKYVNQIRKFFISGMGFDFIDCDYESLEPHVFAHVSGEQKIKDIFINNHDFYSTIAIDVEGLSEYSADKKADNYLGKLNPEKRQAAKPYSLGIPYGMTPFKLKFEIDCDEKTANKLYRKYLEAYPKLAEWMEWSDKQFLKKGEIQAECGRKRRWKKAFSLYKKYGDCMLDDLELYQAYHKEPKRYNEMKEHRRTVKKALNNCKNVQIQILATSIVNRSAIAINKYMKENNIMGYVCAQIHDQLIVRVESCHTKLMKEKVQEIMENTYKISVDLKAPAMVAKDWYEGH